MTTLEYINRLEDVITQMEKTLVELPEDSAGRYKMEARIYTAQCLIDYIRSEVEEMEVNS